jgi:hypothetical protein
MVAIASAAEYDREMLKAIPFLIVLAATVLAQDSAHDEAQVWNLEKAYWEYDFAQRHSPSITPSS